MGRMLRRESGILDILMMMMLILMLVNLGNSDVGKDKEECGNQLGGLATCLPYVGGDAKAPTQDCCTGLKQVLKDSKKCLCILVKDRNDPDLGLKINATLALTLPLTCHAPANVSECPALLHLAPDSPDAKVFSEFGKAAAPTSSSTSPIASSDQHQPSGSRTSGKIRSDGGMGIRLLPIHMIYAVLVCCFASHFIIL